MVEAVKETLLLVAVQRQIGRIQVDHNLLRCFVMRFQENVYQQFVHAGCIVMHFLVTIFRLQLPAQFQPVQCALAGQRFICLGASGQQHQQRVFAQLFGIVQGCVPESQAVDTLSQHLAHPVPDSPLIPAVQKTLAQTAQQTDALLHLLQE